MPYNDLINVKFTDLTSHQSVTSGDILGCAFEYHWGPVNTLLNLTESEFYSLYPESLPVNSNSGSSAVYFGYASLKNAFQKGVNQVEVVRPRGNWKYQQIACATSGTETVTPTMTDEPFEGTHTGKGLVIASKYPGYFPKSICGDYTTIRVVTDGTTVANSVIVKVEGSTDGTNFTTIEKFQGGFVEGQYIEGQPNYITEVINGNSDFIQVSVVGASVGATTATFTAFSAMPTAITEAEMATVYETYFADGMSSTCTLLMAGIDAGTTINAKLASIANERQNLIAAVGYATTATFTASDIETALGTLTKEKFSVFVAGREYFSVFGVTYILNCVGGWCGCTARIARTAHLNQLASAFTYGSYAGSISKTISLKDANRLMQSGVISIISTVQGPVIWGTHSLNNRQQSYYGKANVMRVIADILRNAFPIALDAIHTDAAANELTRSQYHMRFNAIVDARIADQDIQSDSYADCMGELNNDTNSKGGTVLNVLFSIHPIGLVEKVNIHIVATDSSVSATLS